MAVVAGVAAEVAEQVALVELLAAQVAETLTAGLSVEPVAPQEVPFPVTILLAVAVLAYP